MRHLTREQLLNELDERRGIVPIEIDVDKRQLLWLDLETYHCYEGFFHKALDRFAALKQSKSLASEVVRFTTDLTVLLDERILTDSIHPSGFIFHAGRCGSTLLTRVLARDRSHLVFGEALAHNQIWQTVRIDGKNWPSLTEEHRKIYKHLLLAMGRRRLPAYAAHFIKFTSYNILFFDFIRSVFPEVPAIFLYRAPSQIMESFEGNPPAWLNSISEVGFIAGADGPVSAGKDSRTAGATALSAFLAAGLRAGENGAMYLNYNQLTAVNLPAILSALNVSYTSEQLRLMCSQFRFDSKVEHGACEFIVDPKATGTIPRPTDHELAELYQHLERSERNIIGTGVVV